MPLISSSNCNSIFFRLTMKSLVVFKVIVMFFLISHLPKGWVSRIVLYWFKCYEEFCLMHMKLSYLHKFNCYSQCSRSRTKGLPSITYHSSSRKEFELKYQITTWNITCFNLTAIRRILQHLQLVFSINILLLITVGYQMTVTISRITFIASNPKHARPT